MGEEPNGDSLTKANLQTGLQNLRRQSRVTGFLEKEPAQTLKKEKEKAKFVKKAVKQKSCQSTKRK